MPDTGRYQLRVSLVADASNPQCLKARELLALRITDQGTPKCWTPDGAFFLRIDAARKIAPSAAPATSPLRARKVRIPAKRKGAAKKRR